MKHSLFVLLWLFLLLLGYTSCEKKPQEIHHITLESWAPDVKANINAFLDKYAHTENAYVVFDFDNTCSIFDVENQTLSYQIETMSYALNPEEMEKALSAGIDRSKPILDNWLKDICNAYGHLYKDYGPFTPAGLSEEQQHAIRQDPWWNEFAAKITHMYQILNEVEGTNVTYVWILYRLAGMTEKELYALCQRAFEKYSKAPTAEVTWKSPTNLPSCVGPVECTITNGIQVTDNIRELWKALHDNGIDVWVCSASATQPIMAAIDYFGLQPYCKGMMGMTLKTANGLIASEYDYETGYPYLANPDGTWSPIDLPTKAMTSNIGKVTSIENTLKPRYGGKGPLAGFMDSTGDFWFCTMFKDMRMAVCFNRATRKTTEGGGLIAETAIYQRDHLKWDFQKSDSLGETLYLLQGREENGLRTLRPSNATMRLGATEEKLFAGEANQKQLDYMMQNDMTTQEIINKFCIQTADSTLGFIYGWIDTYEGYHSK